MIIQAERVARCRAHSEHLQSLAVTGIMIFQTNDHSALGLGEGTRSNRLITYHGEKEQI